MLFRNSVCVWGGGGALYQYVCNNYWQIYYCLIFLSRSTAQITISIVLGFCKGHASKSTTAEEMPYQIMIRVLLLS